MIRVRVDVGHKNDVAGMGDEILAELEPRARAAVEKGIEVVRKKADDILSRPARSADGNPTAGDSRPALRSGKLRRSIRVIPTRVREGVVSAGLGSNLPQALPLEFGGTVGRGKRTRIRPHPWIRPAMEQSAAEVERVLEEF